MSDLLVVKVGGGLCATPGALARACLALERLARTQPIVVVPGGGPFADQVRAFTVHQPLPDSTAHWMAILGMDQLAQAIAALLPGAALVESAGEIANAVALGQVPVLAPYRWLRATDELPHGWAVTSDSLAAYLAGLLGASSLLLIKPTGGTVDQLTDPYFRRALPATISCRAVSVAELEAEVPAAG